MTYLQVCLSTEVRYKVRSYPSLVTVRLIVEIYHVTLREELCWVCAEISDSVDMRERLHTEFAIESAAECVENLVLLLGTVPDVPLMHVSHRSVGCLQAVTPRRTWVVWYMWALGCNGFWEDLQRF